MPRHEKDIMSKPKLNPNPSLNYRPIRTQSQTQIQTGRAPAPARTRKAVPSKSIMESTQQSGSPVSSFAKAQGEGGKLFEGWSSKVRNWNRNPPERRQGR